MREKGTISSLKLLIVPLVFLDLILMQIFLIAELGYETMTSWRSTNNH